MFEILFTGSTAVLRLATLVKSAEVWVQIYVGKFFWCRPVKPDSWPTDQTYSSLFQIIFMEDQEE